MGIWLEVCVKLEDSLPPGDPVLVAWKERLCEFQQGFPLLQQLASKALKVQINLSSFIKLGIKIQFMSFLFRYLTGTPSLLPSVRTLTPLASIR